MRKCMSKFDQLFGAISDIASLLFNDKLDVFFSL